MTHYPHRDNIDHRRRLLLGAMAATALPAGLLLSESTQAAPPKIKSSARIVIAGAGAAGLSAASFLAKRLESAEITLVDGRTDHYYQPGFTLVAAGIQPPGYTRSQTADYLPANVKWIRGYVAEFDPEGNSITTTAGQKIPYDFLLVTTGLKLDYAAIDGMDEALIGQNGLGSIYHSPEAAFKTWQLLDRFANNGGEAVFLRPATEMKCSGAPLKYTFIVRDYLYRRGTLKKSKLTYNAHNDSLFSVPIVSERVRMLFEARNVDIRHHRVLSAIDPGRRIAVFSSEKEGKVELPYDFINVIPPMCAPDVVKN